MNVLIYSSAMSESKTNVKHREMRPMQELQLPLQHCKKKIQFFHKDLFILSHLLYKNTCAKGHLFLFDLLTQHINQKSRACVCGKMTEW